jgi:hypothetical protein
VIANAAFEKKERMTSQAKAKTQHLEPVLVEASQYPAVEIYFVKDKNIRACTEC